jgi:aminopeptidase
MTVVIPEIDPAALEVWASILIDHSLGGVGASDRVMIKGERVCWPLMAVLERKVVEAGGVPDVHLVPPNNERGRVWSSTAARHASPEQLEATPEWYRERYESMTKYVEVLGAEDPGAYSGLTADQVRGLAAADRPFANIRLSKPWVLTLFPTEGFAEMEGMDLETYTHFIVDASTTDPSQLLEAEQRIAPVIANGNEVIIETIDPRSERDLRLTVDISPSRVVQSYGLRNFPDGEVFTSPDARKTDGEIFVDLPVHYGGHDIQGIYLKFAGGTIVDYSAEVGEDQLTAIIESDEGSHRLGELAFGMNPGLTRVLKHPLLVEKVGGTMHIAIGASYEDCFVEDPGSQEGRQQIEQLESAGILNRSSQHVDIVTDFRAGGCGRRVTVDGRPLVSRDGLWQVD